MNRLRTEGFQRRRNAACAQLPCRTLCLSQSTVLINPFAVANAPDGGEEVWRQRLRMIFRSCGCSAYSATKAIATIGRDAFTPSQFLQLVPNIQLNPSRT